MTGIVWLLSLLIIINESAKFDLETKNKKYKVISQQTLNMEINPDLLVSKCHWVSPYSWREGIGGRPANQQHYSPTM